MHARARSVALGGFVTPGTCFSLILILFHSFHLTLVLIVLSPSNASRCNRQDAVQAILLDVFRRM